MARSHRRPGGSPTAVRLRAGTFNIHHGVGSGGRLDLDRTAGALADADLDVVALQEVDRNWSGRSDFIDQAGYLADRLGMHLAFGPCLHRDGDAGGQTPPQYGTALLSRQPIVGSHNRLLPRLWGGEQRALLEADIALVGGRRLRCLATHLQHRSRPERLVQAEVVTRTILGRDVPTVLLGDLNARPGSPEVVALTRHLADAWEVNGGTGGYTFSARAPHARIDYVFASRDITVEAARVVPTDASDHLLVAADLLLPAPADTPGV